MATLITTNAIILSRLPWSESSQIVSMMTPEHGRLSAIARGSRKITSGVGPALEPMAESQVVLSTSASGDLAHVRTADVVEPFSSLRKSLVRISLGSALCELVARTLPEDQENVPAYVHVRAALAGIDAADDRHAINWLWRGVLDLAGDLGYAMQFDTCASCGNPETPHLLFDPAEGGPICVRCRTAFPRSWLPETQETLRWLLAAEPETLGDRRIPKMVNRDIRFLLDDYFRFHVPNFDHLKSLDMLASLGQPAGGGKGAAGEGGEG